MKNEILTERSTLLSMISKRLLGYILAKTQEETVFRLQKVEDGLFQVFSLHKGTSITLLPEIYLSIHKREVPSGICLLYHIEDLKEEEIPVIAAEVIREIRGYILCRNNLALYSYEVCKRRFDVNPLLLSILDRVKEARDRSTLYTPFSTLTPEDGISFHTPVDPLALQKICDLTMIQEQLRREISQLRDQLYAKDSKGRFTLSFR